MQQQGSNGDGERYRGKTSGLKSHISSPNRAVYFGEIHRVSITANEGNASRSPVREETSAPFDPWFSKECFIRLTNVLELFIPELVILVRTGLAVLRARFARTGCS
jgi:hypothetical protein